MGENVDYNDSTLWRLVLVLPVNGDERDAITVHLHELSDGRELYKVSQPPRDGGCVQVLPTPKRAFSKAFELAAWPIRARLANAKDFS